LNLESKTITRPISICLALAVLLALLGVPAFASADEGITAVSRYVAAPGEEVTLTIECACLPPCKGRKGHRHPEGFKHGPCTLGSKAMPPLSFGVSLLPAAKLAAMRRCARRGCPNPIKALPSDPYRAPYTFLGSARPPAGGNNPESGEPSRYLLKFSIPDLRPGAYDYVIWSRGSENGHRGRLNVDPGAANWRLSVRAAGQRPGARQPTSRAGHRRLRAEHRRDWARR
jgi:hypothetical protein